MADSVIVAEVKREKKKSRSGKVKSKTSSKKRALATAGNETFSPPSSSSKKKEKSSPSSSVSTLSERAKSFVVDVVVSEASRREALKTCGDSAVDVIREAKRRPSSALKKLLIVFWTCAMLFALSSLLSSGSDDGKSGEIVPVHDRDAPNVAAGASAPEDDENLEQKNTPVAKMTKKATQKFETSFACEEVVCVEKCAKHVTKKCAKSESCMKERAKYCRKKCRKLRCESRCKDEPAIGYVEREMRLEKCQAGCGAAKPAKCRQKCSDESKSCKLKCKESLRKWTCDREPEINFPSAQAAAAAAAAQSPKGVVEAAPEFQELEVDESVDRSSFGADDADDPL